MTTEPSLPPHLDNIGRQLVAAAYERNGSPGREQPRRIRLAVGAPLAAVAPLAAAALAVIVLTSGGKPATPRAPLASTTAPHPTPLVHPTAKQVLVRAAYVALQTTPVTPQPNQFIYTKIAAGNGQTTQSWMSVDGTRTSMWVGPDQKHPTVVPGCATGHFSSRLPGEDGKPIQDFEPKDVRGKALTLAAAGKYFPGRKVPMDGPLVTTPCTPQPAFFPDMPTDPSAMQAYLVKIGDAYPPSVHQNAIDALNNIAKNVGYMLDTDYLLPAQQAALYRFLSATPGIIVKQGVEDVTGRPGIGIEWNFMGYRTMLIFGATSYQYLGMSQLGNPGHANGSALLQTAIVDSVGSQPASAQATPGQTSPATQTSTSTASGVS